MKVALATFIGARRTNHSAIVGSAYTSPKYAMLTSSSAGSHRQHACQALSDIYCLGRNEVADKTECFCATSTESLNQEEIAAWLSSFALSFAAMVDSDYVHAKLNPTCLKKVDQMLLQISRSIKRSSEPEGNAEQQILLGSCYQIRRNLMLLDSRRTFITENEHVPMSDAYLYRYHQWKPSGAEQRLRHCLTVALAAESSNLELPPEMIEELSIDAGLLFYRSLTASCSSRTPPETQISHILSLFKLGVELRSRCSSLFSHVRNQLLVASNSPTLEVDFVAFTGRARVRLLELVSELEAIENESLEQTWLPEIQKMLEAGAEILLRDAKMELEWVQAAFESGSELSTTELSAIGLWASGCALRSLTSVAVKSFRQQVQAAELDEKFCIWSFTHKDLQVLLNAYRVGSFVYGHLVESVLELESAISHLVPGDEQVDEDFEMGTAELLVKAALLELS
ncbi:hypothetical protein T439DRAFT_329411 [Meredithblackwellia eburnea MCA 4105]